MLPLDILLSLIKMQRCQCEFVTKIQRIDFKWREAVEHVGG